MCEYMYTFMHICMNIVCHIYAYICAHTHVYMCVYIYFLQVCCHYRPLYFLLCLIRFATFQSSKQLIFPKLFTES